MTDERRLGELLGWELLESDGPLPIPPVVAPKVGRHSCPDS